MQKIIFAILGSPHEDGRTEKMLNYAVQIAELLKSCDIPQQIKRKIEKYI